MARTATPKRGAKTKPKAGARKPAAKSRSDSNKLGATKRGGQTRAELYQQLCDRGVTGHSRLSKDEMADLLKGKRRRA